MVNLTQASRELFSRSPDERFSSVEELYRHCKLQREGSTDRWQLPQTIRPATGTDRRGLAAVTGSEANDDKRFCLQLVKFLESIRAKSPDRFVTVKELSEEADRRLSAVLSQQGSLVEAQR